MLSCRDIADMTSDYLNKDLPVGRRLAVRLHLLMCVGCSRYYVQMRNTVAMLRRMGHGESKVSPDRAREIFKSSRDS